MKMLQIEDHTNKKDISLCLWEVGHYTALSDMDNEMKEYIYERLSDVRSLLGLKVEE